MFKSLQWLNAKMWNVFMAVQYIQARSGKRRLRKEAGVRSHDD